MDNLQKSAGAATPPAALNSPLNVNAEAKACLFNLIIYAHEPRRIRYFQEMIDRVMPRFPCRIILIHADLDSHDEELHVQSATKQDLERGVICDQISIAASSQNIDRVCCFLFSLLIPDLPIYLLWGQDPANEPLLLPRLEPFASRLIVDSEAADNLQKFSLDLLARLAGSPIPIVDMNWARLEGWREVLAQTFDSQERFDQLAAASHIILMFNEVQNDLLQKPRTQAIYLQAWLASRLGWRWERCEVDATGWRIGYRSAAGVHEVRLASRSDERFEPEEVLELEIGSAEYECRLQRIDADHVRVQSSNQCQCTLPFTLLMPTLKTGRNLMQEIFYHKVSSQYLPTLKLISAVNWNHSHAIL